MTLKLIYNECGGSGALRRYARPQRVAVEILVVANVIYLRTPRAVNGWRELVDQVLKRGGRKRRLGKQQRATS